jgi:hypothetical protein
MLSASYGDVESYAASASFGEVHSYDDAAFYSDAASYGDIETLRSARLEQRPAFHVVAIVIVSEVPPPLAAKFFANTAAIEGDAPWENLSWRGPRPGGTGPLTILGDTWEPPLAIKGQAPDGTDETVANNPGVTDVGGTLGGGGVTNGLTENGAAGGGNRVSSFLPNNDRGNTFLQFISGRDHMQPPLPPTVAMASYFSAQSLATTADNALASPFGSAASLRDQAFDDYSSDSLLLASDASGLEEERECDELSDQPDDEAAEDEEDAGGNHSLFDQAAQVALDALQRERRAIEAVLEALNDIKIADPEAAATQSATYHHRESPRELALEDWRFDFGHTAPAAPAYDTEGGMVLLENSGDANSNAYDLTAAFVAEVAPVDVGPRQLEAALGMYQAIDVGASDLNGSARSEQSIAKPDVKAPASVSAENAPAKKSEQPSA